MIKVTSAIIIVANEILSGSTLDTNSNYIAKKLEELGINLLEVRVIKDNKQAIIDAVNELRSKYDYIFTTGGIGPTHDDITSESIAEAFDVALEVNEEAKALVKQYYDNKGEKLNSSREKMFYIPKGATLIKNDLTLAPGFNIANVFVFAGVPSIMYNMFEKVIPQLKNGPKIHTLSIVLKKGESIIAEAYRSLQDKYPLIEMGSYPLLDENNKAITNLVLKSTDKVMLENSATELEQCFIKHNLDYKK